MTTRTISESLKCEVLPQGGMRATRNYSELFTFQGSRPEIMVGRSVAEGTPENFSGGFSARGPSVGGAGEFSSSDLSQESAQKAQSDLRKCFGPSV